MYVKPTPGLSIRDPDLMDLLPESGRLVPDSDYWVRRLRDKDVEPATPPSDGEAPAPTSDHEGNDQ